VELACRATITTVQTPERCDVLVIGGAIMGSSVAYFLKSRAPTLDVCVVEPDPTYEWCSTLRASGGVRVLFSCPENIRMSLFGREFIRDFPTAMTVDGRPAPVDWVQGGYLFIVPPVALPLLAANARVQREEGCDVALLTPGELRARFPSMRVDDLGGGVHSPDDGWCDPNGLLQGLRRKAIALGARYVTDRVVGLSSAGHAVRAASLASGREIAAHAFVNAAGPWAAQVGAMADMPLPISPLRRFEHYFTPGTPIERLPYVKDLDRLAFRSEGVGFSGGLVDGEAARGFDFDVDHDYFERAVWPALAARFPAFEAARCHRTWSGLYEQCELDGNPIIGNWPGRRDNFYVVGGFSGHGMMHAPAAGRAIAELIVDGRFVSLDLTRLGYARVLRNEPYAEAGIV
jgi:glycine/D-amino acid oxidase-like deaminating enzyme